MRSWINKRFTVDGMEFDAAIDYCHELHHYSTMGGVPEGTVPVELYNCEKNWDIYMIYPQRPVTDEAILQGIREWIDSNPQEWVWEEECPKLTSDLTQDDFIRQEGGYAPKDVCDIISSMMLFSAGEMSFDRMYEHMRDTIGVLPDVLQHLLDVYRQAYGEDMKDGPYTA